MPDLYSILDPVPLKWRFTTAAAVPLIAGLALYPFVGFWSIPISAIVAVVFVWLLGGRQMRYFRRTAIGILRTRSIDRRHRLPTEGPAEQRRIAHAVNRLADNVELTLLESQRNRRYYETILNELTVGILVVDANGILQYANPAAHEMLGFEISDDQSGPTPLASKVSIYEINEAVAISATSGDTVRRNVEIYDTHRHLEVTARGLPPEESGVGRSLVIVNDRTDEIRLGVSIREFVANASHELRTPIASIQASVETLKLSAVVQPKQAEQFLDRIDDGAHRMAALVSELMDLTLLETGRMAVHQTMVSPGNLIGAVMEGHGPVGEDSTHEIEIEVAGGIPDVLIDVPKIERAIGNLLVNARKFTPDGGRIKISCRSDGADVVFAVEDTGEGIDPEEIPHIFERFYKSHRSSGDRSGFGLGLAITKNIVELHQGSVEVESNVGAGSIFTVRLPIS